MRRAGRGPRARARRARRRGDPTRVVGRGRAERGGVGGDRAGHGGPGDGALPGGGGAGAHRARPRRGRGRRRLGAGGAPRQGRGRGGQRLLRRGALAVGDDVVAGATSDACGGCAARTGASSTMWDPRSPSSSPACARCPPRATQSSAWSRRSARAASPPRAGARGGRRRRRRFARPVFDLEHTHAPSGERARLPRKGRREVQVARLRRGRARGRGERPPGGRDAAARSGRTGAASRRCAQTLCAAS